MSTPGPLPLDKLDGSHAQCLQHIDAWIDQIYPGIAHRDTDRTRQWWAAINQLAPQLTGDINHQKATLASLIAVTAELLLRAAEQRTEPERES